MWRDPTDTTFRKPRRTKGTPAYKTINLISLGAVSLITALLSSTYYLIKGRYETVIEPSEYEYEIKELRARQKALIGSAIMSRIDDILKQKQIEKEQNKNTEVEK